jgi:hypothetical protein
MYGNLWLSLTKTSCTRNHSESKNNSGSSADLAAIRQAAMEAAATQKVGEENRACSG